MNPKIQHIDREKNPPTLVGSANAVAWEADLAEIRRRAGTLPESDATVALWIVFAPWAHPFWPYHVISAIHLREIPGMGPATINLPGATHEALVYAMDPLKVPDLFDPFSCLLRPGNFHGQWRAAARPNPVDLDRAAAEYIRKCVDDVLAGVLNPDTDARSQWIARFSDSNILR